MCFAPSSAFWVPMVVLQLACSQSSSRLSPSASVVVFLVLAAVLWAGMTSLSKTAVVATAVQAVSMVWVVQTAELEEAVTVGLVHSLQVRPQVQCQSQSLSSKAKPTRPVFKREPLWLDVTPTKAHSPRSALIPAAALHHSEHLSR